VLCELIAQSSCMLFKDAIADRTPMYAGIDKTRFRRAVKPGDVVETRSTLVRSKLNVYVVSGEARVNGELCASGEFTFIVA
jgi:3-hydroxyacyl-[acyl-carrier-protein] dehydratase